MQDNPTGFCGCGCGRKTGLEGGGMKRRTRLTRLDREQLTEKLTLLRARRSRLASSATNERRHLKRAEQRILAELAARAG